jgi:hypothetical protein
MAITINKFKSISVELFDKDRNLVGVIESQEELLDVRVQIAKEKVSGYYFVYEGDEYRITEDGVMEDFPSELYQECLKLCVELFRIQKERSLV